MLNKTISYLTLSLCLFSLVSSCEAAAAAARPAAPATAAAAASGLQNDQQKTLYALGLLLGQQVKPLGLTPAELKLVHKGMTDAVTGAKPQVELAVYGPKVNELAQTRSSAGAQPEKARGAKFAATAAKEAGAVTLPSGVIIKTVKAGTGASPTANDTVRVHYEGRLIDGTVFDSSIKRGEPAEFEVGGVVPCWTQGLQKMKVGEKVRLVCPSDTAYGDHGNPPSIPGGSTLVFDVELLAIPKKAGS